MSVGVGMCVCEPLIPKFYFFWVYFGLNLELPFQSFNLLGKFGLHSTLLIRCLVMCVCGEISNEVFLDFLCMRAVMG